MLLGFKQNARSLGQHLDLLLMVKSNTDTDTYNTTDDTDTDTKVGGDSSRIPGVSTIKQRSWSHVCWVHGSQGDRIHSGGEVDISIDRYLDM